MSNHMPVTDTVPVKGTPNFYPTNTHVSAMRRFAGVFHGSELYYEVSALAREAIDKAVGGAANLEEEAIQRLINQYGHLYDYA